jgi:hypothetical protein
MKNKPPNYPRFCINSILLLLLSSSLLSAFEQRISTSGQFSPRMYKLKVLTATAPNAASFVPDDGPTRGIQSYKKNLYTLIKNTFEQMTTESKTFDASGRHITGSEN